MAINSTDILSQLQRLAPSLRIQKLQEMKAIEDMPVEVSWPDQSSNSGETRRVIAVYVENSGDPEVPTLRLICGMSYDPEQPTAEEAQQALDQWHDAPKAPDFTRPRLPQRGESVTQVTRCTECNGINEHRAFCSKFMR